MFYEVKTGKTESVISFRNPMAIQRNHNVLFESNKNIRESQGKISSILPEISAKIREFFPQIVMATL